MIFLVIGVGLSNRGTLDQIEIGIGGRTRDRLMPPAEQKPGHGEPLDEMLALEPCVKFSVAPGCNVVEDRQNALCHILSFFLAHDLIRKPVPTFRDHARAATTMISTL
jgi:hypothetical protein